MLGGCSADAVFLLLEVEMGLEEPELFLDAGAEGASWPGFEARPVKRVHQRAC